MPASFDRTLRRMLAVSIVVVGAMGASIALTTPQAAAQQADVSGDANCSGTLDITDALVIAQYSVGLRTAAVGCAFDPLTEFNEQVTDVDDSGVTDIVDALAIAQCTVGAIPCPLDTHVTVMTFNVAHACINGNGCMFSDPRPAMTRVAEIVVEHEVDVFGLQEVDRGSVNHQGIDAVAFLHSELVRLGRPAQSWFENMRTVGGAPFGVAMFTTLPVVSYEVTEIFPPTGPDPVWEWWLQELVVDQNGTEVRVYNTHLPSTSGQGWACWMMENEVLPEVRSHDDQITHAIGDFNFRDNYPCYAPTLTTHVDACGLDGDYGCSHSVDPEVHGGGPNGGVITYDVSVDFIFHDLTPQAGAVMVDAWGMPDLNDAFVVSDHLPVFAEYDLASP